MPRFNHAEISASCVHLCSISSIVSSLNKLIREGPPALSLSPDDPRVNRLRRRAGFLSESKRFYPCGLFANSANLSFKNTKSAPELGAFQNATGQC
jgi:hypothetical protein